MVFSHILEFLIDYFTNLNVKKIVGGILVLVGTSIVGKIVASGDPSKAVLLAILGIAIAGIGFVIIYYDMAKDSSGSRYNELETLTKAYKQNEEAKKVSSWHMTHDSNKKEGQDDN